MMRRLDKLEVQVVKGYEQYSLLKTQNENQAEHIRILQDKVVNLEKIHEQQESYKIG